MLLNPKPRALCGGLIAHPQPAPPVGYTTNCKQLCGVSVLTGEELLN